MFYKCCKKCSFYKEAVNGKIKYEICLASENKEKLTCLKHSLDVLPEAIKRFADKINRLAVAANEAFKK